MTGKAERLETGTASADYVNLYHGNASLLIESLEVIQQTSGVILAALQPPAAQQAEMPDAELISDPPIYFMAVKLTWVEGEIPSKSSL